MGVLHDISKIEQEYSELKRSLDFFNVCTPKRKEKLARFYQLENQLRALGHTECFNERKGTAEARK